MANEIQLLVLLKAICFETINIVAEDALYVVSAIQWYAEYIDFRNGISCPTTLVQASIHW